MLPPLTNIFSNKVLVFSESFNLSNKKLLQDTLSWIGQSDNSQWGETERTLEYRFVNIAFRYSAMHVASLCVLTIPIKESSA